MLTYTFEKNSGISLYEQLYRHIKADILSGRLRPGERLPSKRTLSAHLEVSVVTVQTAYDQLSAEGYLYTEEKKGYYVMPLAPQLPPVPRSAAVKEPPEEEGWFLDFVTNSIAAEDFPFTVWAKVMRRTILDRDTGLLRPTPPGGAYELRQAIADYLCQFRGMEVEPRQVIIGAGTEVLYHLLIQLLGRDKCYAVEDPGYHKIARIYENNDVQLRRIGLDESGLSVEKLRQQQADVVHISPSHHYPTGIVMPIARRQELLRWAGEQAERYILEDDYDSEFRFVGRPIPTLFSVDQRERVIYLNTFSKTIAPSIRISYMILPPHLLERYGETLGFYACTVSGFEQYTLAQFMAQGHYEQHLSRMKKRYHQKRDQVIRCIRESGSRWEITEQDAGLHFLVKLPTSLSDGELLRRAAAQGIRLALLSDYYSRSSEAPPHVLVVNYSGLELSRLTEGMKRLQKILEDENHV